ncbi:PQQ-binding-like beta-propeller repeat protein [Amnibacterium endophyticum]|uniref:PQQ-binding-like beta-propeller repeat protein n=1 Tax=Amnibacterium endophyticum TaxID=2109337 RepID=A0ABW4LEE6_9MICO
MRVSRPLLITTAAAALLALTGCSAGAPAAPRSASPSPGASYDATASSTWPGYHADDARSGAVGGSVRHVAAAWQRDLGAAVYGQPVVADGLVVVGTEADRVVALDERTGAVRWSASVGRPVTDVQRVAGCGNVDPLGITSTPVIDPAAHRVYVVGEVLSGGGVQHRLAGFDLRTGHRVLDTRVDPPLPAGEHPAQLLQRAGLALANGRVYVPYGGNSGDCGSYHGWVVGARTDGSSSLESFEVASDGEGGAIWMSGGAPAVTAAGDLLVSTGNANPDPPQGGPDPKRYTESAVLLSPDLEPIASFKDRTAGGDEDLSTGNPVLVPGSLVLTVGKTDTAYLLRASDLHEVAAIHGVCGSDPDGGPAVDAVTGRVFIPCRDGGIQEVDVAGRRLGPKLDGANSAPILVGGTLWAADYGAGTLTGYDATTGRTLQTVRPGALPHFASPSSADDLLLLGTTTGVRAFRASS